ncbi:MAG TPA: hypothetical protein VHZ49_13630 [Methylomirabilota bacterium]|jgi:hypothetical protein|nr:hypothetical protein [Methylomirabilota bacterium]
MINRDGILRGLTAGVVAAGVMSAARLLAHRAGLLRQTVPQVVHERVAGETGFSVLGRTPGHQLAAELMHHGVGAVAGGALGAVAPRPGAVTGLGYGFLVWLADHYVVLPALAVKRGRGRAVDVAAHLVFGAVLAFAMRELARQPRLQPTPTEIPLLRHVG